MKVKKLIKKLYAACISGDVELQQTLWRKTLKKSLKHKDTHTIK